MKEREKCLYFHKSPSRKKERAFSFYKLSLEAALHTLPAPAAHFHFIPPTLRTAKFPSSSTATRMVRVEALALEAHTLGTRWAFHTGRDLSLLFFLSGH